MLMRLTCTIRLLLRQLAPRLTMMPPSRIHSAYQLHSPPFLQSAFGTLAYGHEGHFIHPQDALLRAESRIHGVLWRATTSFRSHTVGGVAGCLRFLSPVHLPGYSPGAIDHIVAFTLPCFAR